MHNALTYALLVIALFLYLKACKVLIDDARHGAYVTMGGDMYFGNLWNLASIFATIGIIRLIVFTSWIKLLLIIPIFIILFLIGTPVRRTITTLFLGRDLGKQDTKTEDTPDQGGQRET